MSTFVGICFRERDYHWDLARSYVEQGIEDWPDDLEIISVATYTFLEYQFPVPAWLSSLYEVS